MSDADFAVTLGAMARFRTRLVHLYWDVDDGQVQEYGVVVKAEPHP